MKGKNIAFLILPAFVYGLFLFIGPKGFVMAGGSDHKVSICHATSSETNPYNKISVDKNSTAGGHSTDTNDIIPPFTYYEWEVVGSHQECPSGGYGSWAPGKTCEKKVGWKTKYAYPVTVNDYDWVSHTFPGNNYDALGQAILANNCVVPPAEEDCPTTCGYAGGTVPNGLGGFKTCPATKACEEPEMCKWDDRLEADDPECPADCEYDSTISEDDLSCVPPTMCKWDDRLEADDPECPKDCEYDSTISEDNSLCVPPTMCKWDDELEADDPECPADCEYDSTISEDDPLCAPKDDEDVLGEDDEVKDTGVVLGATGPEDNLDIYLVELLLVAISFISYVFFSKKYLKNSR